MGVGFFAWKEGRVAARRGGLSTAARGGESGISFRGGGNGACSKVLKSKPN